MWLRPSTLLLVLGSLALAGCSTPMSVTTKGALDSFRPLTYSRHDTCATQQEIAEHNSRYDTLKTGKEVVYKAPCASERIASAKDRS